MKRRSHKSQTQPATASDAAIALRLQRLWLGGLAALLVATPLIPSESAASLGTGIVLVMLWLVLLVAWCSAKVFRQDYSLHASATTCLMGLLILLIVVSTWFTRAEGHPRPMINTAWQWISFGIAFWLCREVIRTEVQRRAMVVVMLALAVSLSGHGYYQTFYSMPKTRLEYEANPEATLAEVGIFAPPGSAVRSQFENRLYSSEPLATFSLTNSLAGLLSPWLLVAIGIGWSSWREPDRWRMLAGASFCIVLVAGCWVLTKSRSAMLATAFGVSLLVIYARQRGWRPDWRLMLALVAAPILLVFFGMIVGGLDVLVLTESAKSLQYRFEYWQATSAMIADYPWLGCGPGNFQQFYTSYKLPAASETISDPHNFLLEIWATAGTPAIVVFLALLGVFAFQVRRAFEPAELTDGSTAPSAPVRPTAATKAVGRDSTHDARFIYAGAGVGILLAYFPCGFLVGFMPDTVLFLVGYPLGLATVILCHPWVERGQLGLTSLVCGIVVLLVNLMAAGGITMAGVSLTLWLLLALALNKAEGDRSPQPRRKPLIWILTGLAWLLVLLCHRTAYDPILRSSALLAEGNLARQMGRLEKAEAALELATRKDPYASLPWQQLASLRHDHWLRSPTKTSRLEFELAVSEMLKRSPHSSSLQSQVGHWYLAGFRFHNREEDVEAAVAAYQQAAALYPNHSLGRAQLAWAAGLAGNAEFALEQAEEALRLDQLNPHREQKLAAQKLSDPGPVRYPNQPPGPLENAEQTMRRLRSQVGANANSGGGND